MQATFQTTAARPSKRLWRHAIRAVTACILAYLFLHVWKIANGPDLPVQYTAGGRIYASETKVLSNDNAETVARKAAMFQAYVAMHKHPNLLPNAVQRVLMSRPELKVQKVRLHFSTTTRRHALD
jgi:hypothetical protein